MLGDETLGGARGCLLAALRAQRFDRQHLGYARSNVIGLGAASLELDTRYNVGKYFHVGLAAGGEVWLSKLTAERADGSELFHSRRFNANIQLGLGSRF